MGRQYHVSRRDVLAKYRVEYETGIADGSFIPFVYPIATLAGGVALLFMFIPPQSRFHNVFTRYLVFAFIACWHVYYIRNCRALNMTSSFGAGILSAWLMLWSAVVLVFDDKKAIARRIERRRTSAPAFNILSKESKGSQEQLVRSDARSTDLQANASTSNDVRRRKAQPSQGTDDSHGDVQNADSSSSSSEYYWQAYPTTFSYARLEWICDLWTNFRGVGWDFSIGGLPSTPSDDQRQLFPTRDPPPDKSTTRTGITRYNNALPLLLHKVRLQLTGYLLLDIFVILTHHDPYFWGLTSSPAPAFIPFILRNPTGTRFYRLLTGMSIIWLSLRMLFTCAALIFIPLSHLNILPLGVRAEPWMYPDHWGSYLVVLDRGLGGWWGGWWHQTFRYAFEAAGGWICGLMGVERRSMPGKMVMLFAAFGLSGVLHACGSTTQPGPTSPWTGPFAFFALQPVGIVAEMGAHSVARKTGMAQQTPRWLTRLLNFVWVHAWFVTTGPLLVDDMAKGGLWMIEPVGVSPLRGLGFGVEGDGWWCWGGGYARWYRDPRGWLWSGIAL